MIEILIRARRAVKDLIDSYDRRPAPSQTPRDLRKKREEQSDEIRPEPEPTADLPAEPEETKAL